MRVFLGERRAGQAQEGEWDWLGCLRSDTNLSSPALLGCLDLTQI